MDDKLFEKLYNAYYLRVYSFLLTLSGERDLAEELTEETFYKAFTSKSSYRAESKELTWLCAIAKNLFLDELKKRKKTCELTDDLPGGDSPEEHQEDKSRTLHIHRILHELKEPYREVFELRIFGELSFAEIGSIFGKTENWARVTYHRAKVEIQERMKQDEK